MNRRALLVTAGALVVSLVVDLIVGYSPFPGYGASLGLLGCLAIIIVSKWIGTTFLDRPEDYYPDEFPPDLHPDLLPRTHPDAVTDPSAAKGEHGG